MSNAKNQLVGQLALSSESGLGELLAMTRAAFSKDEIEPLSETIRKIKNLSSEDILEVANEIFDRDKVSLLIYNSL